MSATLTELMFSLAFEITLDYGIALIGKGTTFGFLLCCIVPA